MTIKKNLTEALKKLINKNNIRNLPKVKQVKQQITLTDYFSFFTWQVSCKGSNIYYVIF